MNVKHTLRLIGAGAVLAAATGTAMAQSDGDFKKPLKARTQVNQPASGSRSTMVMRQDDGQHAVELRVEDGKYSAKVDGESVPQERIVREKDVVRVQDKDGNTISEFHVSTDGGGMAGFGGQPTPPKAPKAPKAKGGRTQVAPAAPQMANPPKVMLGIHMETPSDEQQKEYGVKEGEAILVQGVIDGLPADKAGLKEGDLITEIDGKKPVNQEKLREVLSTKEPGDTVEFTVLRKGGDKSIRITLDKFDPEKLGGTTIWNVTPDEGGHWGKGEGGGDGEGPEWMNNETLRDLLKNHQGQWRSLTIPGDGGKGFVFGGSGADTEKKLAELDKKLSDLDEKLQKVDQQMAKLQELIEKLSEQRRK